MDLPDDRLGGFEGSGAFLLPDGGEEFGGGLPGLLPTVSEEVLAAEGMPGECPGPEWPVAAAPPRETAARSAPQMERTSPQFPAEGIPDGGQHEILHPRLVTETDLPLGRVDVDVDPSGGYLEEETGERIRAAGEQFAVTGVERVGESTVGDRPAVHEQVDPLGGPSGGGRRAQYPVQPHPVGFPCQGDGVLQGPLAEEGLGSLPHPLFGGDLEDLPALVFEEEPGVEPRQGSLGHRAQDVPVLGLGGPQELAPGWNVGEQMLDPDRGTADPGDGFLAFHHPPFDDQPETGLLPRRGLQDQTAHGCDTGQGLAPEAETGQRFQVGFGLDLARGMTPDRQPCPFGVHSVAVIGHLDTIPPSRGQPHLDPTGPGIQRVFHQFLDHRGGALDHLAGSDLVHDGIGQDMYPHAHLIRSARR